MTLISLNNISIAFGHVTLLEKVNFRLDRGERVGLIGRNGEGKSTLLTIMSGEVSPDQGQLEYHSICKVARLSQHPQLNSHDTIFQAVAGSLGEIGNQIQAYHDLAQCLAQNHDQQLLQQLENVQQRLEANDGWRLEQRVETILSKLNLPTEQSVADLSGGWQRRVALAQALVVEPDLLLLDEPTNHLDINTITWLEEILLEWSGGLLFVSHDRQFMQRIATRIIELDRGQLTSYPGDYATYLERKSAALAAEITQAAKFDKHLAQEEVWIRQGIKARRTRNEGRVRALNKLREERAQRREQQGKVRLNLDKGELSGRIVIVADNLSKSYGNVPMIRHFSTVIMRGDRIGLIGANGVGKTTLLKLLLGELAPDSGQVQHGTQLQIAYFDQLRTQLNPEATVIDVVAQGHEMIMINGQKQHVMSYLSDFLFVPARAYSPVKSLSGGERNRLLLARLLIKPANLLVLDEPTNDLDVETLELLEELLVNYSGTLLLVSHDRRFLDNVVTSTLVFEGNGQIKEYVGGYQDWLRQRDVTVQPPVTPKKTLYTSKTNVASPLKPSKLSYKEQRELAELPSQIENLETELAKLQEQVSYSEFYRGPVAAINQTLAQISDLETQLQIHYTRWEKLEAK
jgi:ATP-binding cassette subfamily F protein uup